MPTTNCIDNLSQTDEKFSVIYADPPWQYVTYSKKGQDRSAETHYDCMSLEGIKEMPVGDVAAKDCALFLWVTDPCLLQGLEVMEAWGFKYKTIGFYWSKLNKRAVRKFPEHGGLINPDKDFFTGMGHWTRANCEMCLFGTRGSPKRNDKGVRKLIVSNLREHSRKPDEAVDRIEKLIDGPYLEMFARTRRRGWTVLGNQTEKFDTQE